MIFHAVGDTAFDRDSRCQKNIGLHCIGRRFAVSCGTLLRRLGAPETTPCWKGFLHLLSNTSSVFSRRSSILRRGISSHSCGPMTGKPLDTRGRGSQACDQFFIDSISSADVSQWCNAVRGKLLADRARPKHLRTLQRVRRTRVDWHCQPIFDLALPVHQPAGLPPHWRAHPARNAHCPQGRDYGVG